MRRKPNRSSTYEIDLYGVRHSEVERIMDSFIWENMQKNRKEIKVITGSSNQMKSIVFEITKDYGMDYYTDPTNNGVLIIKLE